MSKCLLLCGILHLEPQVLSIPLDGAHNTGFSITKNQSFKKVGIFGQNGDDF